MIALIMDGWLGPLTILVVAVIGVVVIPGIRALWGRYQESRAWDEMAAERDQSRSFGDWS